MTFLYMVARFWPIIGIALILLSVEVALYYRRSGRLWSQVVMVLFVLLFMGSTAVWVVFRGDQNSDRWVTDFFHLSDGPVN